LSANVCLAGFETQCSNSDNSQSINLKSSGGTKPEVQITIWQKGQTPAKFVPKEITYIGPKSFKDGIESYRGKNFEGKSVKVDVQLLNGNEQSIDIVLTDAKSTANMKLNKCFGL
jgi:hypothetical protein